MDIRCNARLYAGTLKEHPQVIAALAGPVVELANGDKRSREDVANVTWTDDGAKEPTESPQNAARPKGCRELLGSLDPVEQRHYERFRSHQRAHRLDGLRHLPAFHG